MENQTTPVQVSLNYIFHDFLPHYADILSTTNMTKEEFKELFKKTYSIEEPRNLLFYRSIDKSVFNTIKISLDLTSILFNQ